MKTARSSHAIIILGSSLDQSGRPLPALQRRLVAGAEALRAGLGTQVLVSGGRRWGGTAEADAMHAYLIRRGIPPSSVHRELASLTTAENAYFAAQWAKRNDVREATLVTCDFHMARALVCFGKAGLPCRPYPAASPGGVALGRRLKELAGRWLTAVSPGLDEPR